MATPTPGKHGVAVATPPVSTPFSASNHPSHPAFSPHGPRSVVPSPQQVKKSPANSNTMYGYPGGAHGGFQGYDSPSAAMALGGMDLGIDGLGTPSGSGLVGIGTVGGGRGDEDERRKKLSLVMDILKVNKGRLSEAGIERLARKVGLECLWEAHMGSGGSTRTLIIAGSALSLDIDFSNNVVKKVSLSFPEAPDIVTRHTGKAGEILTRDLEFQGKESPLTKKLDRFAENLESLAVLDKLSVIPGLNCYEAIAGIYESLERLHVWEIERIRESEDMTGKNEKELIRTAMCTKSGKPLMHTRDRLGLHLDYWQESRRLGSKQKDKFWSLLLECAPLPAHGIYPPVRVSSNWISTNIKAASQPAEDLFAALEGGPSLDWLEPENTLLPSIEPPRVDAMDQSADQKFPEVMFLAKFDPPLVVSYSVATHIYDSTHATMDMNHLPATFGALLFPSIPGPGLKLITRDRSVPIFDKQGEKMYRAHRTDLYLDEADWGKVLTELPFSHPRQLVEMLPFLRQYAFISRVIGKIDGTDSKPPAENKKTAQKSTRAELEDFMGPDHPTEQPLRVDVSFKIQPEPNFRVVFPFKGRAADVVFAIKSHGIVEVTSQNILDGKIIEENKGKGKVLTVADLGRMLEITEDIGIWIEYVKRRL